ncbi:RNA-binding S4 domain-containing protein [Qipengyuania qiaonensis]|uniref:RNA-binding S4 domain-containing protein n=1 Tax=Qipengyuania qiaonensis TaxID=2867240 RepID=A0ABS7J8R2_9SPHN|nr:RNA-binding S4 domain-containing protein [Qipengyuania qiaonensis]
MRIDRLLCYLRFARTRGAAHRLVEEGHIRRNGERVTRCSRNVVEGDILTLPLGRSVKLVEILALPERRGPPREAEACYRELDPNG